MNVVCRHILALNPDFQIEIWKKFWEFMKVVCRNILALNPDFQIEIW